MSCEGHQMSVIFLALSSTGIPIISREKRSDLTSVDMSQPAYVESLLRRFGMEWCKPVSTPMVESFFFKM